MRHIHILCLVVLVASSAFAHSLSTRSDEAKNQMSELSKSLDMFYVDCGRYPTQQEGLEALLRPTRSCPNWGPDPYVTAIGMDPWNRPWIYINPEPNEFHLRTLGADGREGGTDEDTDLQL